MSSSDVENYLLLAHGNLQDPLLVLFTSVEMLQEQQADHFKRNLAVRLQNSKEMLFSQNEDGTLFSLACGF